MFRWTAKTTSQIKQGHAKDQYIAFDNAKLSLYTVFGAVITIIETSTEKEVCKYRYMFVESNGSI